MCWRMDDWRGYSDVSLRNARRWVLFILSLVVLILMSA
jgi:hypothetical protein